MPNLKRMRRTAELIRIYAEALGPDAPDGSGASSASALIARTVLTHWTDGPRVKGPTGTRQAAAILELNAHQGPSLLTDDGLRSTALGPRLAARLAARALDRLTGLPPSHLKDDGIDLGEYLWLDQASVTANLKAWELADWIAANGADAGIPAPADGYPVESRYAFDTGLPGWVQIDTRSDAWYFGAWTSTETQRIVCYAEGDVSDTISTDDRAYLAALEAHADFHRRNGDWMGIDADPASKAGQRLTQIGAGHLLRWAEDDRRTVLERAADGEYAPSAYATPRAEPAVAG